MPTFDVICTGNLPWSAIAELGRRGVLKRELNDADAPGNRHTLRIEGAPCPDTAALLALRQLKEVGAACDSLEVAAVAR